MIPEVDPYGHLARTLRDDFLSGEEISPRIRPGIASSWQRSLTAGVEADKDSMPYRPLAEGANRLLLQAATPVLDWLADQLTGGMAIVLADADARVLERRSEGTGLSHRLDRMNCAPGFSFAEEHAGTNGIGCVLETPEPVTIFGPEHYRDMFAGMTCLGTALRHPIHRRLVGVLSVTCRLEDTHELMMPIQLSAAREIQSRMYAAVSMRERVLLEEFLKVSRRTSAAVVTLNQDFIMTNTAASTLLNPADHAVLWDWAMDSVNRQGEFTGEVRMSDGSVLRGRAQTVGETKSGPAGVLVELRPAATGPGTEEGERFTRGPSRPQRGVQDPLPGRSAGWRQALSELVIAGRTDRDILVTGESGVGKYRLTELVHRCDHRLLDAALAGIQPNWLKDLQANLTGASTVVIRHIDRTPEPLLASVAALLEQPRSARVIATADSTADCRLLDYFPARVELPPLRQRPEDIPDIVSFLLRTAGESSVPRVQAPALNSLMKQELPGNVRELAAVLAAARLKALGGEITLTCLSAPYRGSPADRALPALKRTERDTILEALVDANGNKRVAADRLGIARSSLYRKMRALGIDAKRRT